MNYNVFISGVAGCGKTTAINNLHKYFNDNEEVPDAIVPGERIRDLIKTQEFAPPSMVATSADSTTTFRNLDFLERLVDWQMVLSNLHTRNMSASHGEELIEIHDRCALDSLVYMMYDLLTWNDEASFERLREAHFTTQETMSDSTEHALMDIAYRKMKASFTEIMDTIIFYLMNPHSVAAWRAIEQSVYQVLMSRNPNTNVYEANRVARIVKHTSYILTQYVKLILETSGLYFTLTRNPFTEVPEDGVRVTDIQVGSIIEMLYETAVAILYKSQTLSPSFESSRDHADRPFSMLHRRGDDMYQLIAQESSSTRIRQRETEEDIQHRLDYMVHVSTSYIKERAIWSTQ